MRVYVIRHGESETNKKGRYTGWFDTPLTELGREEARIAGNLLRDVTFDKIYSSDLSRATETAKNALPDCTFEQSALLREIGMGSLENQPISIPTPEQRASYLQYGYADIGGESRAEFQQRVLDFKHELEGLECRQVAVFSHAGWLRAFLSEVIGVRLSSNVLCCNNCTLAIFEYRDSQWKLYSWINTN